MRALFATFIVAFKLFTLASSNPVEGRGMCKDVFRSSKTYSMCTTDGNLYDTRIECANECAQGLMIVGGSGGKDGWNSKFSKVEIINPINPRLTCPKIEDIPFNRDGAIVEMFDNVPIICGGQTEGFGDGPYDSNKNDCWALKNNKWQDASKLQHARLYSGSIILPDNSLWITGGLRCRVRGPNGWDDPETGDTSEILRSLDSNFEPGPQLPELMAKHCMAQINTTHIAIVGNGQRAPVDDEHDTKMAYLVNVESKPFTFFKLPPLIRDRTGSACGVISMKQPNGIERKVLLAAGGNHERNDKDPNSPTTTEFYDLENGGIWQEGPKLPHSWAHGGHIVHHDTIYLLGGLQNYDPTNDIMVFNQMTNEFDVLPNTLSVSRSSFGVISIDQQKYCNSH